MAGRVAPCWACTSVRAATEPRGWRKHDVHHRGAFVRYTPRGHDHLTHPRSPEPCHHAGNGESGHRMARDDDLVQARVFDIGPPNPPTRRSSKCASRRASPGAGQIDRENLQIRLEPADFIDREFPTVRGVAIAVHQHERGQCHRPGHRRMSAHNLSQLPEAIFTRFASLISAFSRNFRLPSPGANT